MFRSVRRFPLMGLALFGLGFLLASALAGGGGVIGGAAAGLGFLLFLPLLVLKFMFVMFLIGLAFRFIGGGWGRGGPWSGPSRYQDREDETIWRYRGRPMQPRRPGPTRDQVEWEEHLRQARQEVDDLDTPYRGPGSTEE